MAIIALMTDFGTRDYYVAAMKGVILQINPKVTLLDITHEIAAQDLFHGAFVLRQTLPYLPSESIIVAVVDPGVGSGRHVLAARYHDRIVLAPDNGLLSLVHRDAELQEIRTVENRRYFASTISNTFHGRDIFAPVAAHLCARGVPLADVGPPADRLEVLEVDKPRILPDGSIQGRVVVIDRFGNLITNISEVDISALRSPRHHFGVYVGSHPVGAIRHTYSDVQPGEPLALVGSSQMLEIAINSGNAAQKMGVSSGTEVSVR